MPSAAHFQAARDDAVVASLRDFGLVEVAGPDARNFLQGQLSSDVTALSPGDAQYSSFNSPKGRMLANFVLWRDAPEQFHLLLAADLAPVIGRRLAMFVLRAKATVRDVTGSHAYIGVGGPKAATAVASVFGAAPSPRRAQTTNGATLAGLPDGRIVVIVGRANADDVLARLAAHATAVAPAIFDWLGIEAGVPVVTAATTDQFVPQTANWEVLGGVAFDKGCYTGQEIVARMQYLGRLKERLFAFHAPAKVAPATRVYSPAFGDQPCGMVVNATDAPENGSVFLAVVQTAAVDGDAIHVGAPEGPAATRRALPYSLPAPGLPRGRIA